jgi:phosphatidylserine/phosphatidylglycerophosphate/cardiolipin synthase-like enzyme/uncharacterized membrane protein YbhN (UPF0104 family)
MGSGVRSGAYAHAVRLTFLIVGGVAIWRQAGTIHWAEVSPLLASYRWPQLGLAIGLTAGSFLLLGAIEILALRTSAGGEVRIRRRHALVTAFLSHAFSQSTGLSLLTGTALRLRAYGGLGMSTIAVTRVTAYVTVAILLGLLSLGSFVLLSGDVQRIGALDVPARPLGLMLALIVLSCLAWTVLTRNLSPAVAAAQIGLSAFDWYLTASILFVLLPSPSPFSFSTFISVCVVAHTLGMLSLVPGGAGVFEATMFALVADNPGDSGRAALAAALITYRLVYYLLPLGLATAVALVTGARYGSAATVAAESRPTLPPAHPQPAGAAVDWLIDNASAYTAVMDAIGSARRSVWLTQLAFDADCRAYDPAGGESIVADALLDAAARGPLDVRIILNETFLLDTARPLRRFFAERLGARPPAPGTIEVRGVSSFPRLLHAKMVIVDGSEAFLLGSPFVNGYWDDERHRPVDARRPLRELGGRPLHDLSIRVTGTPVAELERLFIELWAPAESVAPPPAGATAVGIVSTSPRGVLRGRPAGATEILDSLLEGIASARSLIYIEHQYLSSRPIVAALAEALRCHQQLEIVAVLNENADVTAYRRWQNARLEESGLAAHRRVGLFALWTAARGPETTHLNQVFVHSKVVVVDDVWATAGSANLDGVSLDSYGDDFSGLGRRVFRHTRNFDVNVNVTGRSAACLRSRLWSEHLGSPSGSLVVRPAEGWLSVWRARAAANVAALNAVSSSEEGPAMRGFVLPYSAAATPARQLADLGVRVDPRRLEVRFDPGWLEVHFSPNWVRNMFS